jgi:hypothetical protein
MHECIIKNIDQYMYVCLPAPERAEFKKVRTIGVFFELSITGIFKIATQLTVIKRWLKNKKNAAIMQVRVDDILNNFG